MELQLDMIVDWTSRTTSGQLGHRVSRMRCYFVISLVAIVSVRSFHETVLMWRRCSKFQTVVLQVGAHSDGSSFFRSLSEKEISKTLRAGYSYIDRLAEIENHIIRHNAPFRSGSACHTMSKFKKSAPEAIKLSRKNLAMLEISKTLKEQYFYRSFAINQPN